MLLCTPEDSVSVSYLDSFCLHSTKRGEIVLWANEETWAVCGLLWLFWPAHAGKNKTCSREAGFGVEVCAKTRRWKSEKKERNRFHIVLKVTGWPTFCAAAGWIFFPIYWQREHVLLRHKRKCIYRYFFVCSFLQQQECSELNILCNSWTVFLRVDLFERLLFFCMSLLTRGNIDVHLPMHKVPRSFGFFCVRPLALRTLSKI